MEEILMQNPTMVIIPNSRDVRNKAIGSVTVQLL